MSIGAAVHAGGQTLPKAPLLGTVSGTVTDADGALVGGATVTAKGSDGRIEATASSDQAGNFVLRGLPGGQVLLVISAANRATRTLTVSLADGQHLEQPPIALAAASNESVNVTAMTPGEIATEEVHVAEHQRVLGIVPNFNVVYALHPVPLSAKQKLSLSTHELFDPTTFLFTGISAGIFQATNTWPGYHQGAAGYGKRYGAILAGGASDTLLTHTLFPILFRQDPRYYFKSDGTAWQRARYALATTVVRRGDNGRWQPNYMTLAGGLSSGALAQLYLPPGSRSGSTTVVEGALLGLASSGISHLMQQFVFVHLTTQSRQNQSKP